MDTPSTPPAPAGTDEEGRAREYEATHNRLFLIRIVLTVVALAVYLFSGASGHLAAGLRSRFGNLWPVVNGLYTMITVFGFSAVMFPLSLYGDYTVEHRYGLLKQSLESWSWDYLKSLVLEIILATVFFEVVYALLWWTPDHWWLWATGAYVLFVVVLTSIAPVVIMPLFHTFEPLDNPELTEAVKEFVQKAGLNVLGVFRWGLEEKTQTANAALAGIGKTRRIILGDTMLSGYSKEEILAVLAHEVGHYRNRDIVRLIVAGAALASVGFYIAHISLRVLVRYFGFEGAADIASFPVFVFCLFVFSLITMPVGNAYSRRREWAADEYAVRSMGSAGPLVTALEKLAAQNLADKNPAPWIEFLLHSHPSIGRRVRRAQEIEKTLAS